MNTNTKVLDFSAVIDRDVFAVHLKTQSQSDQF